MALDMKSVGLFLDGKKNILLAAEYARLRAISDRGTVSTFGVLTGLFQRMSQVAQIPRGLEM